MVHPEILKVEQIARFFKIFCVYPIKFNGKQMIIVGNITYFCCFLVQCLVMAGTIYIMFTSAEAEYFPHKTVFCFKTAKVTFAIVCMMISFLKRKQLAKCWNEVFEFDRKAGKTISYM